MARPPAPAVTSPLATTPPPRAFSTVVRMRAMPTTVVSLTLEGPFDWPNATVVGGDGTDVIARLKEESDVHRCARTEAWR